MFNSITDRNRWPWHALLGAAILILFTAAWSVQTAFADDESLVGRIETMPPTGLIGEWQVDGFAFTTSQATQFRAERGDFAVGRCVEVEYVSVATQAVATKVVSKSNDDCQGGVPTVPGVTNTPDPNATATATPQPSATHEGGDDGGNDDGIRARGIIEALPDGALRGIWTISGVQYEVGAQTRLRQKDGPIAVGACVELWYQGTTEPFKTLRLETQRRSKCGSGATPTPGSTIPAPTLTPQPSRTPDDDGSEIYGTLDSFPTELIGAWVIAGEAYTATVDTEFSQKRGVFTEGICVKAELFPSDATLIREVETTNGYRCGTDNGSGNGGGNARGDLYGVIQEFPAGLIGEWQIGGTTVTADATTSFNQRKAPFAQGVTVKVHFVVLDDGTFFATEIETKFAREDHGDDHDHNDVYEGAEGHAYGLIESFPADLLGQWQVSGISYTVTSETRIVQPHSDFAVGGLVFVKYRTDADGNRIVRQIKTTRSNGDASSEDHAMLYGFVETMPTSGFVGEWVIDGVSFDATETTKFKEEHGLLGLGSYVKMEYRTVDGRNVLHEIESQVPPGAGDNSALGEIESIDDGSGTSQAAMAAIANVTTWTINGQQYVITAATDLNDFQGALEVGQSAFVNSYVDSSGNQVATQIRGVTLAFELFLPAVNR